MAVIRTPTQYAIWLEDDRLYCDLIKLEDNIRRNLGYSPSQTSRLISEVERLLKSDIDGGQDRVPVQSQLTTQHIMVEALEVILKCSDPKEMVNLLSSQKYTTWSGKKCNSGSMIHFYLECKRNDIVKVILDCLNVEEIYEMLTLADLTIRTPVHIAFESGNVDALKMFEKHNSKENWSRLLRLPADFGMTPLHCAASAGHADIIKTLRNSSVADQWSELLQMKNYYEYTPLHVAAYRGYQPVLEALQASVSNEEWIKLLTDTVPRFNTGCNWNRLSNHSNYLRAVQILGDKLEEAKLTETICYISSEQGRDLKISIENEPLTAAHIEKLSSHSPCYVIPRNQKNIKRYGLIFYNPVDRYGAENEASNLEESLGTAGFAVSKLEWFNSQELFNMMQSSLEGLRRNCSLLVVCLMAHGSRGGLQDSVGKRISVNDVLHQLNRYLPSSVPLVVLIQACQVAPNVVLSADAARNADPSVPSQVSDPFQDQHITLTRRHTVLLLATVREGKAIRNAFTAAMASQFRRADGETDIGIMFDLAVHEMMKDSDCVAIDQCPEFRKTTTKSLTFPLPLFDTVDVIPIGTLLCSSDESSNYFSITDDDSFSSDEFENGNDS